MSRDMLTLQILVAPSDQIAVSLYGLRRHITMVLDLFVSKLTIVLFVHYVEILHYADCSPL